MFNIEGKFANANVMMNEPNIDENTYKQIIEILNSPCSENSMIAIMPDVHAGVGCCIGFTQRFTSRVVPNFIGVDIGCGMFVVEIPKKETRKVNFEKVDKIIRQQIPTGDSKRDKPLNASNLIDYSRLTAPINELKIKQCLGTLGGGNHFIEIDKDEDGNYYLVIHSGSRHLGYAVWEYWQKVASSKRPQGVPEHLAWLKDEDREKYLRDILICQQYSHISKEVMAEIILDELGIKKNKCECWETQHNYIDRVNNIIRKGSINGVGKCLIPINMRDGALIVRGKSTEEFNWSLPHGSGRLMSRKDAKETLKMEDFKSDMKGIFSTCVKVSTIDEAPRAYKDINHIKENIKEYADIISELKPVYNFKAN